MKKLFQKIENNELIIGIMGLGYVGLPLAMRFTECDFKVIGFDIDQNKINLINAGESYIDHIDSKEIKSCVQKGLAATSDYSAVSECDALIMCVPTPLNVFREPDLSYINNTIEKMLPHLKRIN